MGTLNLNIEYLTYTKTEYLKDFDCYGCKVPFSDQDLNDNNFILGVSDYRAEHKNCPDVERCEECFSRYRKEEMRQSAKDKNWYCLKTCWADHAELRRDAEEINNMVCRHLTLLREIEKENAIFKYHLATISHFVNLDNLGIKGIEHKAGQVIINLRNRREEIPEKSKEKVGLQGINEVMSGVMEAQRKHVERMKETEKQKEPIIMLDEYEKEKPKEPDRPNSFKKFAEGMNKVECIECKKYVSLAECIYDPARNKHTCHSCDKKLKEAEAKKKEAKTQEKIKELEGGIK
ncbi:13546_t:CDS:2 [Gigaspora margarita]|uniref:13546_t:CDS:1 n=1 Tax=Gigaspora margarita TaxID=4874 RepID=A0ABM8W004_GIGMA|nr:13546_t:CDS:2 [Gigaspora margarita]